MHCIKIRSFIPWEHFDLKVAIREALNITHSKRSALKIKSSLWRYWRYKSNQPHKIIITNCYIDQAPRYIVQSIINLPVSKSSCAICKKFRWTSWKELFLFLNELYYRPLHFLNGADEQTEQTIFSLRTWLRLRNRK